MESEFDNQGTDKNFCGDDENNNDDNRFSHNPHSQFSNQYENISKNSIDNTTSSRSSHLTSDNDALFTSLLQPNLHSSGETHTSYSTTSPRRRISPQNRCSKIQDQETSSSNYLEDHDKYSANSNNDSNFNDIESSLGQKSQQSTLLLNAKTVMDSIKFSQRYVTQKQQYQRLSTDEYYLSNYDEKSFISRRIAYAISIIVTTLIVAMLCIIFISPYANHQVNYLGETKSPSKLGTYASYAISTDASSCSPVGTKLIEKGGSAVDAAIGTLLCMGVVLPNSMGIGGGSLMIIYTRSRQEASIIDGREEAPDYANEDMFGNDDLAASRGPLSVGVPGEIMAYHEAHTRHGRLNWSDLFEDPIRMAEEGVPLVEHMHYALHDSSHAKHMRPSLKQLLTNPKTGDLYREGEILKRPDLAKTLRRIRDHGYEDFYGGETGKLLIEDLKRQGGKMTLDNLMRYKAKVKSPVTVKIADDLIMHTQPVPGSGHILSLILRIMGKLGYYGKRDVKDSFQESELYYHRLVEAFKFAYAQRGGLEDYTEANRLRLEDLEAKLNSDMFVQEIVRKIGNITHDPAYYGGQEYFADDHGTAHVSVIDKYGNSVAVTTSVNLYFGSGLLSESTGIIYNDIMDDFVSPNFSNKFGLAPSKHNRIAPGKRPLSSMVPSIFTNSQGDVKLSIGASGGTKITSAVASVCLRHLYLGEDIKTAVDGPRLHHQLLPNSIVYEQKFPQDLLDALKAREHQMNVVQGRSSVVMAIASNVTHDHPPVDLPIVGNNLNKEFDQIITANSDYRKGGSVGGA